MAEAATRKTSGATDDQANREKGTTTHLYPARRIRSDRAYNDTAEVFRPGQEWPGEAIDMVGWFNRRLRRDREDGAALVEFAFVLPFLLLVLMGIVEYGWAFSQHLDVRHGAREAGRLATVNVSTADIRTTACAAMDFIHPANNAIITLDDLGAGAVGDAAEIDVIADLNSLTGFLDWALPATLHSTVEVRLEQAHSPAWSNLALAACP